MKAITQAGFWRTSSLVAERRRPCVGSWAPEKRLSSQKHIHTYTQHTRGPHGAHCAPGTALSIWLLLMCLNARHAPGHSDGNISRLVGRGRRSEAYVTPPSPRPSPAAQRPLPPGLLACLFCPFSTAGAQGWEGCCGPSRGSVSAEAPGPEKLRHTWLSCIETHQRLS